MNLDDVDLFDLDRFRAQEHHEMFKVLREEAPVYTTRQRAEEPLTHHLSRWTDVREVNRDTELWSSEVDGVTMFRESSGEADASNNMNGHMMLTTDPPKHTRYRRLVSKGFTPRMIGRLESLLEWRTHHIIDQVIEKGSCEFVEDIASELPLQAIADFVGVPQEDRKKMFEWSNAMIGIDDPNVSSRDGADSAAAELYMYSRGLSEEKKACPMDDVFSVLVATQEEEDGLTDLEIDMFFMLLTVAGNETTRNATAHGMHALIEHPEQMAKMKTFANDDDKLMVAIDEVVRWGTPVTHFTRTATADTELRGVKIAKGEKVVLWHCSSNRDDEGFEDPFTFDIERTPNDHTGFGAGGAHYCLGANLAKIELKLVLREILNRMPDISLAGEPERLRSNFINGINTMPVQFTPGPRLDLPAPEGVHPAFL
jgi:cholest-4-en-3-one 26-monooxygenase